MRPDPARAAFLRKPPTIKAPQMSGAALGRIAGFLNNTWAASQEPTPVVTRQDIQNEIDHLMRRVPPGSRGYTDPKHQERVTALFQALHDQDNGEVENNDER